MGGRKKLGDAAVTGGTGRTSTPDPSGAKAVAAAIGTAASLRFNPTSASAAGFVTSCNRLEWWR